jgi:hypothetical protein
VKLRRFAEPDSWGDNYRAADVIRVRDAVMSHGYECSHTQARDLWQQYSDGMAASWMSLPDEDGDIVQCVSYYIEE